MEKQFEREFEIDVPAKGVFGDPPDREKTVEFVIPNGFSVQRNVPASQYGAVIVAKNLESMDEKRLDFNAISDGVNFIWKVANPHSFPVTGRTASIKVRLTGIGTEERPPLAFSDKYQQIRQRFFDNFYYEGHVAEFIEGDRIKFADQTIYMGQALIFLASEVYIKRKRGEDIAPSLQKMGEIFAAIEQLDRDAEPLLGHPSALDGFVARDNITGPGDPRLHNRFAQVDSDWQKPEDAAPSGDQIFGLLFGFWAVVRLVEDAAVVAKARELSDRIFLYAKENKFELTLPDGKPVARGADMRWLASLLHGLNKAITGNDRFDECRIEVLGVEWALTPIAAFWDGAGDDAADILRATIDIPILGEQTINSFAAHILLMAIAPGEVWSKGEVEEAALSVNHHLAALIYAFAHNTTPNRFGFQEIQAILDKCPASGPRSDLPLETGWQKDNRWIRAKNLGEAGSGHKEYNGVDFLLLHNLARIVFGE